MRLAKHHYVYFGLAVLVVVCGFILVLGWSTWDPIRERGPYVRRGMSEEEVEALLGPCTKVHRPPQGPNMAVSVRMLKVWEGRRASCWVVFDGNGRVMQSICFNRRDPN